MDRSRRRAVSNRKQNVVAFIVVVLVLALIGGYFVSRVHNVPAQKTMLTCIEDPGNVYDFVRIDPTALPYVVQPEPAAASCRYEFPLLNIAYSPPQVYVTADKGATIAVVYSIYGGSAMGYQDIHVVSFYNGDGLTGNGVTVTCTNVADQWDTYQACPVQIDVYEALSAIETGHSAGVAKTQLSKLYPNAVAFSADSPGYGVAQTTFQHAAGQYLIKQG